MSLRVLLVIIGVLIIAAVYFAAAVKRRRDNRTSFDRRFTRFDVPDAILSHENDRDDEAVSTAKTHPDETSGTAPTKLSAGVILPPEDVSLDDLPRVRHSAFDDADSASNARRDNDQLDMFGAAGAAPAPPLAASKKSPPQAPAPPDNGLINLFVRAREDRQFSGGELVRALNAVGMTHGEMSIFHHMGSGELRCDSALFSAANMFEPGTFDLSRIEATRTSGVVLFLQLPVALEGPVVFELLLNTGQRLAELLGGELYASPQKPLDPGNIAAMRERAARFNHVRA